MGPGAVTLMVRGMGTRYEKTTDTSGHPGIPSVQEAGGCRRSAVGGNYQECLVGQAGDALNMCQFARPSRKGHKKTV